MSRILYARTNFLLRLGTQRVIRGSLAVRVNLGCYAEPIGTDTVPRLETIR